MCYYYYFYCYCCFNSNIIKKMPFVRSFCEKKIQKRKNHFMNDSSFLFHNNALLQRKDIIYGENSKRIHRIDNERNRLWCQTRPLRKRREWKMSEERKNVMRGIWWRNSRSKYEAPPSNFFTLTTVCREKNRKQPRWWYWKQRGEKRKLI